MALTQKEMNLKCYKSRKDNGLCPRCGKLLDRKGHYCSECLKKVNTYNQEARDFCREHHICTVCRKEKVFGDEHICLECRAKYEERRKPLTDEQKIRYAEKFKNHQKSLYRQRSEQGICTRCGKRKAIQGKKKCGICLNKDAEIHRKRYFDRQNIKEYRKENHLCYYCGCEIDLPTGQVCSKCLEKCRKNGEKSTGKNYFKKVW